MGNLQPLKIGDLVAEKPVIQGGMGVGISLSSLAGAVARAGGVGIISTAQIGFREPDFASSPLEANLRAIGTEMEKARRKAAGGIVGFNIMVATKNYPEYVRAAVRSGTDLIISGAGLPVSLPEYVSGSKTKIAPIVSSLKSAMVILKMWDRKYKRAPDLVVIEGPRAGGHLGFTAEKLRELGSYGGDGENPYDQEIRDIIGLVQEYSERYGRAIPVVTAGGIFEYRDVARQLELGADGVQVATRFVTTHECDAPIEFKQAYLNVKKEDIVITKSPVGMPGRAIRNRFLKTVGVEPFRLKHCYQCLEKCDHATIPYCITEALVNSARGDVENGLIFCGDNACRCQKMETVEEVLKALTEET